MVIVPGDLDADWSDPAAVAGAVLEAVAQRKATLDVVNFEVDEG